MAALCPHMMLSVLLRSDSKMPYYYFHFLTRFSKTTRPTLLHFCLSIAPAALNLWATFSPICQRSRSLGCVRSVKLSVRCLAAKLSHWREGLMHDLKYIMKHLKHSWRKDVMRGKKPQEKMGSIYFAINRTMLKTKLCYVDAVMQKKYIINGKHP